jgi:zinc/manganese transport system substrate-binding protein
LAKAVDWIRLNGVKALFLENVADQRFIDQIAKETGLSPGGKLYTDALHNEKGRGDTYESMFRYNVETIVSAMTR